MRNSYKGRASRRIPSVFLWTAFLSIGLLRAGPQSCSSSTSITTDKRQVTVDVIATDQKHEYLKDLTAADLQLWDDGKKQQIDSLGGSDEGEQRHAVLFFDLTHLNARELTASQIAASDFLRLSEKTKQQTAVINFGASLHVSQSFTSDLNALGYAVKNVRSATGASVGTLQSLLAGGNALAPANGYSVRDIMSALSSTAKDLSDIAGRKTLILFDTGIPLTLDIHSTLTAVINACARANVAVYVVDARAALRSSSDNAVFRPASYVIPVGDPFQSTSTTAGPGPPNSLTNPVQTNQSSTEQLTFTPERKEDALQRLAEETGGFVVRYAKELSRSLEEIDNEQSRYYLLRFTPEDSNPGTCHSLKIKALRSGVLVRSQARYCTSKPQELLSGTLAGKLLETDVSNSASGNVHAAMTLPYFYSSPNKTRVVLTLSIPAPAIMLQKYKHNSCGNLDVLGIVYDQTGDIAAKFSDEVKIDLDNRSALEQFLARPYNYETQFDVPSGSYRVKVVFRSGAEGFGKVEMPLKIDAYDGKSLGLSGVVLSKHFHPLSGPESTGMDSQPLDSHMRLVSNGVEVSTMGKSVLHAGDVCALYVEAYDPALTQQFVNDAGGLKLRPAQVGLSIVILNLETGQKKLDTGFVDVQDYITIGNPVIPIALKLPTATLSAGHYRVYVRAKELSGTLSPLHSADFEIE